MKLFYNCFILLTSIRTLKEKLSSAKQTGSRGFCRRERKNCWEGNFVNWRKHYKPQKMESINKQKKVEEKGGAAKGARKKDLLPDTDGGTRKLPPEVLNFCLWFLRHFLCSPQTCLLLCFAGISFTLRSATLRSLQTRRLPLANIFESFSCGFVWGFFMLLRLLFSSCCWMSVNWRSFAMRREDLMPQSISNNEDIWLLMSFSLHGMN